MATVVTEMTMSLDGYVADEADRVDELFGWYEDGPVATPSPGSDLVWRTSEASAGYLRDLVAAVGAVVFGRRTFDLMDGFGGRQPYGVPLFFVTHEVPAGWQERHPDADVTFVTDGVESAIEQAAKAAGDGVVCIGGPDLVRQALDAGLLDEVRVHLAPVVLGGGVPFFAGLGTTPVRFDDPRVVQGTGVTHLAYRVRRG